MNSKVNIPMDRIAEFCCQNRIRKLALFGSVLREDFRADSDVDVLVEFYPEHIPGLSFFRMQRELSQILGRKVDMNTSQDISRYYRGEVLTEAEVFYDAS